MKSHELLRDVFQSTSPKELAAAMDLSVSTIYKWAEPSVEGGSGAVNPLDRVEALINGTHDQRIVHWICERSGGFFVANPKGAKARSYAVVPATNRVVQEFAEMLSVIANAALDNDITSPEAEKIRTCWEELKTVTESFVNCCEQGNFQTVTGKRQ